MAYKQQLAASLLAWRGLPAGRDKASCCLPFAEERGPADATATRDGGVYNTYTECVSGPFLFVAFLYLHAFGLLLPLSLAGKVLSTCLSSLVQILKNQASVCS